MQTAAERHKGFFTFPVQECREAQGCARGECVKARCYKKVGDGIKKDDIEVENFQCNQLRI